MKKTLALLTAAFVMSLFFLPPPLAALEILTMTTYHDNGKVKERYSYFSDEWSMIWKHGPYQSWNYVGLPDEVMQYEYNTRQGSYTRYLYNWYSGELLLSGIEQGTYEDGRKVGTWTITPQKTEALQGRYEYAEHGNTLIRSKEEKKYLNGYPWFEERCELKDDLMLCVRTDYYSSDSGKVSAVERTEPDGFTRRVEGFHLNGARSYAGIKTGDSFQGQWSYWADDGFPVRQTHFLNGQKHGEEIEYPGYDSGVKDKVVREYVYGARHGEEKRYAEAGGLLHHHRYVNGFQEGEQRDYYYDLPGKLFTKWFMKGGLRDGPQEGYYQNGGLESRSYLVAGKFEGLFEQFYEDGSISLRGNYRNHQRHGTWESFYDSGQISSRGDYKKDKATGVFKHWREDGTLESEYTYVDDVKHGSAYFEVAPYYYQGTMGNGMQCGTWTEGWMPFYNASDPPWTREYGPCEGLYVAAPETPYDPVPPADTREIRGRVTAAADGRPISGIQVYAGTGDPPTSCGDECTTTDGTGYYRLLLTEARSYPLQFSGSGFYKHTQTADLAEQDYLTVNVRLKSLPPPQQAAPAVTKFTSRFGGVFLSTVPVTNTYTAAVNWNGGAPGTLRFTKNGTPSESIGDTAGGSRSYNMGGENSDFIAGLSTTANTLTVQAIGTDGKTSSLDTLRPMVIPTPTWSVGLGDFSVKEDKGVIRYGLDKTWPEEPFSVQINPETLGDTLWSAWSLFPLVGGQKFGIPPTQFGMGVSVGTDGVGGVSLGGTTGFEAAGALIEGTVKGTGKVRYESGKGLAFAGADLNTGIKGTIKREVGPVTLIPALSGAVDLRFVGRFFKWFNNTVKIDGSVTVGTDLTLGIVDTNGQLGFKPAEGALTSGMELGIGSEVEAFKTRLSGGGTGKIMWQIPASPGYYKASEFTLNAKLDVNWKLFSSTYEYSHTFPESGSAPQSIATGFRPVSRTYLNLGPYNQLVAPTAPAQRLPFSVRSPLEVTSAAVISNIYPYAGPALAQFNNRLAMAYVYNDPEDPPLQATEIYVVDWDGTNYTVPAPILNEADTRADFSPVLAFDANGALVSVWERVKVNDFTGTGDGETDMENMAAQLEIVYAVRDPATGVWSVPAALTDNSYLDHAPLLAKASDGSILLAWRSNGGNLLSGTSEFPTRIHTSVWNPATSTFAAPVDVGFNFIHATQYALAYRGDSAVLVYVYDPDGDPATSGDQEIYRVDLSGSTWSDPAAVTADAVADFAPQALYDQNGVIELAWRRGG